MTAIVDHAPTAKTFARMVDELTRRGFLTGGLGSAALLGLAACDSGTGSSTGSHSGAGYPVSVSGKYGTTTVTAPPQRIVSLGLEPDADAVLALGVVPVAVAKDPDASGGIEPWTTAKLAGRNTTLLDTRDGPPLEQIAALRPDLIVATTMYSLDRYHDQLARIAPVLAYRSAPNIDTWQDKTTRLGRVLRRSAQADAAVAAVERLIVADRTAHPEFAGKTFTSSTVQADGTIYTTADPHDLSSSLKTQLGLKLSPMVQDLPPTSTPGKSIVGPERLELLDADVINVYYVNPAQRPRLEANPLFQRLGGVERGAYLVADTPVALSAAFPSVLSVPYALEHTVPQLARALA